MKAVSPTQEHIDIASIRDGIVYTKAGSLFAVLEVTPLNFALKSEEDQDSLVGQFQSFLNALYFPIQVAIHSRRIDISDYLKKLTLKVESEANELLRIQGLEYVDFIQKLTTLANIMEKRFYLTVYYSSHPIEPKSSALSLFGGSKNKNKLEFTPEQLKKAQDEIGQRTQVVLSGLQAMGMEAKPLTTSQLVELYYKIYNPDEGIFERIGEGADLNAPIISQKENHGTV